MRKAGSFLAGAMIGSLVGATLGLLLTPASGADLQAQFKTRMDEIKRDMDNAATQRRAELETQLAALRAPKPREEEAQNLSN